MTIPRDSETILVVEDEPGLMVLIEIVLREQNYRVLSADSGVKALAVWAEHAHGIDLVITDMLMPDGMSGGQLAEKLRAMKPELKVLFTSGDWVDSAKTGLQPEEKVNFLQKPFLPQDLIRMLRKVLES